MIEFTLGSVECNYANKKKGAHPVYITVLTIPPHRDQIHGYKIKGKSTIRRCSNQLPQFSNPSPHLVTKIMT